MAAIRPAFPALGAHSLFISAFAAPSKGICDDTYSIIPEYIVDQNLCSLKETNQMAPEMLPSTLVPCNIIGVVSPVLTPASRHPARPYLCSLVATTFIGCARPTQQP